MRIKRVSTLMASCLFVVGLAALFECSFFPLFPILSWCIGAATGSYVSIWWDD